MRHQIICSIALMVALGTTVPAMAQEEERSAPDMAAQAEAAKKLAAEKTPIRRLPNGKPDLNGSWNPRGSAATNMLEEHTGGFGIASDGPSLVVDPADGKIPYQPWALKERERRRQPHNAYEDNRGKCYAVGAVRTMWFANHIVQTPDYFIRLAYEREHRWIARMTDSHLPDGIRLWMGDPIAHWDGDTLVIETTNLNGRPWMNFADFMSKNAKIVERITPINRDTLNWEATITDPVVFTRPWTIRYPAPWVRATNDGPTPGLDFDDEDSCHEGNVNLVHFKNNYEKVYGPSSSTYVSNQSTKTVEDAQKAQQTQKAPAPGK